MPKNTQPNKKLTTDNRKKLTTDDQRRLERMLERLEKEMAMIAEALDRGDVGEDEYKAMVRAALHGTLVKAGITSLIAVYGVEK